MGRSLVEAHDLSFSYGSGAILDGVSFTVFEGESVAFIGQSGCGKTTLFRLLSGLEKPQAGTLHLDSQPSYMMQQDLLLPWRNLRQNVCLAAELSGNSTDCADELLEAVGLAGMGRRYPHELSGGQRQRASLARCLLQDRPILLLDEPFGLLDPLTREQMCDLVQDIKDRYNKTVLLITHDVREAVEMADRIYHIAFGQIVRKWKLPAKQEGRIALHAELYSALKQTG